MEPALLFGRVVLAVVEFEDIYWGVRFLTVLCMELDLLSRPFASVELEDWRLRMELLYVKDRQYGYPKTKRVTRRNPLPGRQLPE